MLIGVVHLKPLPGSPRWQGGLERVIQFAVDDARAYERGGAQALFIENFGDVPFPKTHVGPETIAAMAAAGRAVRAAVKLPIGFNVLRNDACAALALCAACGGSFIRVNVHTGAMLTDQGLIEGDAYATLRYRERVCPQTQIFADVHVKHAVPLGDWKIEDSARDTLERGVADALIISGSGTGLAADVAEVQRVRRACPAAKILLGSGVNLANIRSFLPLADGFIVGTSLKRASRLSNPIHRAAAVVAAVAVISGGAGVAVKEAGIRIPVLDMKGKDRTEQSATGPKGGSKALPALLSGRAANRSDSTANTDPAVARKGHWVTLEPVTGSYIRQRVWVDDDGTRTNRDSATRAYSPDAFRRMQDNLNSSGAGAGRGP